MKTHYAFLFLMLVVSLTGCEKSELINFPDNKGMVSTIKNEKKEKIDEYEYNRDGTLKESWHNKDFYTIGEHAEYKYTYNNSGQLIKKTGYEPGILYMSSLSGAMGKNIETNYTYNNGKIAEITTSFTYENESVLDYKVRLSYEYPNDSTVKEVYNYIHPAANSINSYNDYIFDANGDITNILSYTIDEKMNKHIHLITSFTYDNQKAPYSVEPNPTSKRNPLTKKIVSYSFDESWHQTNGYTSEYTYEYTYNENGFPQKITETYPNKVKIISYITYK